jgi:hypothetical protein
MRIIEWGAGHVAFLDDMRGEGLLLRPRPQDDMEDPRGFPAVPLHQVELDVVVTDLALTDWHISADDCGDWFEEVIDGRTTIALYGGNPITSDPDIEQMASAQAEVKGAVCCYLMRGESAQSL